MKKKKGPYIIVPKKVFPRAVDRNRVKRRIRAAMADLMPYTRDIRIRPARNALTIPFSELKQMLRTLFPMR